MHDDKNISGTIDLSQKPAPPPPGALEEVDRFDNDILQLTVDDGIDPTRLDQWLAEQIADLSRSRIKKLIEQGCIRVNNTVETNPSHKVKAGNQIELQLPELESSIPLPENIPLDIVFEDDDIIIINKPAGLVVHPGAGNWTGTLVNALLHHCGESLSGIGGVIRPGIVHRLDKDTSGLIVAAKNDMAHASLRKQFDEHTIDRAYKALIWGLPRPLVGTIDLAIGRHPHNRLKMAVVGENKPGAKKPGARHAITHYRVIEKYQSRGKIIASLVECRLETGRTHQIRVHLAHLGNPVMADPLYGAGRKNIAFSEKIEHNENKDKETGIMNRQALHAYRLGFEHPRTGEQIEFERDFPDDIKNLVHFLKQK